MIRNHDGQLNNDCYTICPDCTFPTDPAELDAYDGYCRECWEKRRPKESK